MLSDRQVEEIYQEFWPYLSNIGRMERQVKKAIRAAYELGAREGGNHLKEGGSVHIYTGEVELL